MAKCGGGKKKKGGKSLDNEIPQGYYSLGYFLFIFIC